MSAQIVIICDGCASVLAQGKSIGAAARDVRDMGGTHDGDTDMCPYCLEAGRAPNDV